MVLCSSPLPSLSPFVCREAPLPPPPLGNCIVDGITGDSSAGCVRVMPLARIGAPAASPMINVGDEREYMNICAFKCGEKQ